MSFARTEFPESASLIEAFESGSHPELTHADHLQVTWHYLQRDGITRVLRDLPPKLLRYAWSKGHAEHYHETITFAFVCLINERLANDDDGELDWPSFAKKNADLFDRDFLLRYYDTTTLGSQEARRVFVLPRPQQPTDAPA